jgi:hypothetical protein
VRVQPRGWWTRDRPPRHFTTIPVGDCALEALVLPAYPMAEAPAALADLTHGRFGGAAVLHN